MSTPQQNTHKSPRRSSRKPQHGGQHSRSIVSDNDAYSSLAEVNTSQGEGKPKPRRKSHATKKNHIHSDAAVYSDGVTQRSTSHTVKTQATPIKQQAYAGPTFHQSPAASALPIPSFYSKSMPNASFVKPRPDSAESSGNTAKDLNGSVVPPIPDEPKRENTPLDFLFDAARKANVTPGTESPNKQYYLSSTADTPVSRSPAAREGESDFPFELDSGEQPAWENGSAFSTPYKERIEAIRSHRTSSAGGKSLSEEDRKAKSAALKNFLMSSASAQNTLVDNNPFNARPVPSNHPQGHQTYQHRSTPNTPYKSPGQSDQHHYFPSMPPMPPMHSTAHYQSPIRHGPSSNLRNVYHPGTDTTARVSTADNMIDQSREATARDSGLPKAQSNFAEIYSKSSRSNEQTSAHRANPSAQQLEDDLRKILKLDLVGRG